MKITIYFIIVLLTSCSISKKDKQPKTALSVEAKILIDDGRMDILLMNYTKETIYTLGAGFWDTDLIVMDSSGMVIYEKLGEEVMAPLIQIMSGQTFNMTRNPNGWSVDEFFLYQARPRKTGFYTIIFQSKKYNFHESVKVYFDFEKAIEALD